MVSTISEAVLHSVDTSLADVYVGVLVLTVFLSLVSNIVVLTTLYTQHSIRNNMDFFIANMAVSDIISSFSATFTLNNAKLHWGSGAATCKMCYYLVFVSYAVVILTLCLATVDRFYGICLPTKHRQVFLLKRQIISISLIWILSCLLFAPYIYAYNIEEFKLSNDKTMQICTQTWSTGSEQIYFTSVVLFLLYLSPIALFAFVFVKVFQKLQEPRSTASGGSAILRKKRKRMTFVLFMLISLQYVCWTPSILRKVVHIFGQTSPGYFNMFLVFELLHFPRSVFYPLVYVAMYQNFRESLKQLFSSCSSAVSNRPTNGTSVNTGDVSQPYSVPASSAASDRSVSYVPDDDMSTTM